MGLSALQRTAFQRASVLGSGSSARPIPPRTLAALVALTARDLGCAPEIAKLASHLAPFYEIRPPSSLAVESEDPLTLFEELLGTCGADADADAYFLCLTALFKGRWKYEWILSAQPLPTFDQIGPRGLLQYGLTDPATLGVFMGWRKWMFDIDNRAGQETGYLFEPIIAQAIGGAPVGARNSPVKRVADTRKGRQVDCIVTNRAYEFKLRMTIAASGQGRWGEELSFPEDCRQSGYVPVLIVFDPTPSPKLTQLSEQFLSSGGEVFVGDEAWAHLEGSAGPTMAQFIETYLREPLADLLEHAPGDSLASISMTMSNNRVAFRVGETELVSPRLPDPNLATDGDQIPEDAAEGLAGI